MLDTQPALGRRRVLVVDDDPSILEMLELVLQLGGYDVRCVNRGEAALDAVRTDRFGVIITDLRMPGMTGLETLEALLRLDPSLKVIVISGYTTEETERECMQLGASQVLRKPFDVAALLGTIEACVPPA